MAFSKDVTLRNFSKGNYFVLTSYACDDLVQEAWANFSLYVSKEASVAEPNFPLVPQACRLRVTKQVYGTHLSRAALRDRRAAGETLDPREILYEIAELQGVIGDPVYGVPQLENPGHTAAFKDAKTV